MKTLAAITSVARGGPAAIYLAMRRQADRWRHPGRLRRAAQRIRSAPRPRSILVVCQGNVCRSPYLEALLRRALPDIEVSSAGFIGPGLPVPDHSATIAARRGLNLSSHRSRLLTPGLLRQADLVIVMDVRQAWNVERLRFPSDRVVLAGDLDPIPGVRTILDPWRQPLEAFEAAFARLDRCAAALAAILPRERSGVL